MSNSNMIHKIEPFCDIFYKLCFNNSFFPVVRFLGKRELPFLINDIFFYKLEKGEDWDKFSVEYSSHNYFEDLLEYEGIKFEARDNCDNIVDDACESIDKGRPVLIWIDCFYDPLRNDTYHKRHMVHTLLIYGYNKEDKVFQIIDHKYRYSLSYAKHTISFRDLTNCYEGQLVNVYKCGVPNFNTCERKCGYPDSADYRNNCEFLKVANFKCKNEFKNYYEFYIDDNNSAGKHTLKEVGASELDIYCNNLKNNKRIILEGLSSLQVFINQVNNILADEAEFSKNHNTLLNIFNDIINAKLAEKFKVSHIRDFNFELVLELDKIIEMLGYSRNAIVKYLYSLNYNAQKMQEVMGNLSNVLMYEKSYYKKLFSFAEHYGFRDKRERAVT